ncbi:MAG: alpha/beta hydrolase family protein [Micropepsaceae bacterium]
MRTFVLIHGAFHGSWCWEAVAARLSAAGHRVVAADMPGVGRLYRAGGPVVTLGDQVKAVVDLIEAGDLNEITLVGHSLGGMHATAVADRCRKRIAAVVYLDAMVPQNGEAARDFVPAPMYHAALEALHMAGGGRELPVIFPASKFVPFEGDAAARFMSQLTPQPFFTFLEPVRLVNPAVDRRSFIYCSAMPFGLFERFAAAAKADTGWRYDELASFHDAMVTHPDEVAAMLIAAA